MKVILLQDVPGTGKKNAIVTVADGYARNYLIPRNQAVPYTDGSSAVLQQHLKRIAAEEAEEERKANELKAKLEASPLVFKLKTHEGKAFGSVSHKEIIDRLHELSIEVTNHMFEDKHNLNLGPHALKLKVHKNITAVLQVDVQGEVR